MKFMKIRCLALLLGALLFTSCAAPLPQAPDTEENPPASSGEQAPADTPEEDHALILTEDYAIVADPADVDLAERVQLAIRTAARITLPIVTDGGRQDREIVLGDLRHEEAMAARDALGSPFLGVSTRRGERLVIVGGSRGATELAIADFEESLDSHLRDGVLCFAEDYHRERSFGKELEREILNSIGVTAPESKAVAGVETFRIFTPDGSADAWYYNHTPFITKFKDRLYVFYNSSPINEEDCGQRLMLATSADGEHWRTEVLVDSMRGTHSALVLNGRGCYIRDGRLTFFFQAYEYDADTLQKYADGSVMRPTAEEARGKTLGIFLMETADGEHWSEPVNLGYIAGGNASPERLQSGALLWAGHSSVALGNEEDLTVWKNVSLTLDPDTKPTPTSFESDFYQLADGSVILFSRTRDDVMLAAVSFDDGKTWSNLYRTSFPDYDARFRFGRLPDGRIYFLGNRSSERRELVLMTSRDGVSFDTCYELVTGSYDRQKEGLYKGGVYGYPDLWIDGDTLYVAYSLGKESMELLRVPLSELKG